MQFLNFYKNNLKNFILITSVISSLFCGFSGEAYAQKKYVVVLDAGHGGKDSGNLGNGYREKNIALRVALDVGKELLTAKDIEVVYTRKTDVFVELHNRAKIANTKNADLFVSIHCDAFTKAEPHGASTFVLGLSGNKENLEIAKKENAVILLEDNYKQNYDYDPNSPESLIGLSVLQEENLDNSLGIAGFIQDNFVSLKRFNRKVKQANFLVLRETVMPSVLVELGFLTNKAEGRFLNTRQGQIKMAKAIAKAIKKYVDRLKVNTVNRSAPIAVTVVKDKATKKKTVKSPVKKEVVKTVPPKKKESKKVVAKNTKTKTPPKTKTVTSKKTIAKSTSEKGVVFRVQIAASKKKLSTKSFNFKGLDNVKMKVLDDYYKYFYGETSSFKKIKEILKEVKPKGFKDAWIVAFKNGQKISIKEALKSQ
ncbi:N-acetylmuramoyl-L-alanine amidase [Tenacibaculum sp. 190130A14a]